MPQYKNMIIRNSGGNGVNHVYTDSSEGLVLENCLIDGSMGHGINTEPATVDVVQLFGLPKNIDRKALAAAIAQLVAEQSEERRKSLLDADGPIMKSLNVGSAAASLGNTMLAIASNPNAHAFIDGLLKLVGAK